MDNRTIDEIRKNETVLINELKQKEDIINKVKIAIKDNCIKEVKKYAEICCDGDYLLEILDNKGE